LLYLCMLLLPITGLMIMIGNGYGWSPFGKQLVARGATDIEWMATLGSVHSLIAWTLLILVVGHVGMALLPQLVKKDGVLRRMLYPRRHNNRSNHTWAPTSGEQCVLINDWLRPLPATIMQGIPIR